MPARGEGVTWVEKWKIISHSHSLLARGSPRHGGSSSSLISAEPFANRRRLVHRQRSGGGGGGGGSSTRLLLPAGASGFFMHIKRPVSLDATDFSHSQLVTVWAAY